MWKSVNNIQSNIFQCIFIHGIFTMKTGFSKIQRVKTIEYFVVVLLYKVSIDV